MNLARLGAWAVLIALAALWWSPALAQSAPQIQFQVDPDTVGVGDVVTVVMSVTSADTMPGDPRIGSTPGFTVRGQNESPTQTHISINGNRTDRYTLTVEWALQAQRPGTFSIGPPTVALGTPPAYLPHGRAADLLANLGLDGPGIAATVAKLLDER